MRVRGFAVDLAMRSFLVLALAGCLVEEPVDSGADEASPDEGGDEGAGGGEEAGGGGARDADGGCVPGRAVECFCAGGVPGAQACADDGRSFGACDCGGSEQGETEIDEGEEGGFEEGGWDEGAGNEAEGENEGDDVGDGGEGADEEPPNEGGDEGEGEGEGEGEDVPGIPEECVAEEGLGVYERRVEPLVNGGQPSSCNQCHLSGIDLRMFVQDTPCQSMACLVRLEEVNLAEPAESLILQRIRRAEPESDLITQRVIEAEYEGFLAWIEYSATCQGPVCGEIEDPCNSGGQGGPPPEDVAGPLRGACDEESLVAAFNRDVFSWRGRCDGCHGLPGNANRPAPFWVDMRYQVDDPGSVTRAAMRTMYNLIGLGAVNLDDTAASELITKPLAEDAGGIFHGGGDKIRNRQEGAAQSFQRWLDDYAACRGGEELPEEPQAPTVRIFHPANGDGARHASRNVLFRGVSTDPQDGELRGDSLIWRSDLMDGPIGTGVEFNVRLPVGVHAVTVTATDSDGNEGWASVRVRMVP